MEMFRNHKVEDGCFGALEEKSTVQIRTGFYLKMFIG